MDTPFANLCAAAHVAHGEHHIDRMEQIKEVMKAGYQVIHYQLKKNNAALTKIERQRVANLSMYLPKTALIRAFPPTFMRIPL